MMIDTQNHRFTNRAGEYVLGTLTCEEREIFEQDMARDLKLQAEVTCWEQYLTPMLDLVDPVNPPESCWDSIEQKTDPKEEKQDLWNSLAFWRNLSMVAATLVLGLGLTLFGMQPEVGMERVMMIASQNSSHVEWVVATDSRREVLQVKAVAPPALPHGKVCQLWMDVGGGVMKAVGILPHTGATTMPMPSTLNGSGQFKVSVEPANNLPQNGPSGLVIFTGELTKI